MVTTQRTILVTGGTGFVGESVVRELCGSGYSVRVMTRNVSRTQKLAQIEGVEIVEGDIYQPEDVALACREAQAVIHLVGILHQSFANPFEKVHVEATRSVIEGVKKAGVNRYIHMSALGTRMNARSQYHRTKWAGEEIVRTSGLEWTIFRPSLIFGPGDGFVNFLTKFLTYPLNVLSLYTFPRLGGGKSLFQPIAVENVAQAFVRALSHEDSIGRTYDLCGEEQLSLTEILQKIIETTGQRSEVENFPFRTIVRQGVWALSLCLPLIMVVTIYLSLGLPIELIFGLIWLGMVIIALRWKSIILFTLPWPMAFLLAALVQNVWIFGAPLLTVDNLIMLQDGNTGDHKIAQRAFELRLKSFQTGIQSYIGGNYA